MFPPPEGPPKQPQGYSLPPAERGQPPPWQQPSGRWAPVSLVSARDCWHTGSLRGGGVPQVNTKHCFCRSPSSQKMGLTHLRSRSSMMIDFSHQTDRQRRHVRMSGHRLRPPGYQSDVGAHKLILTAWIGTDASLCLHLVSVSCYSRILLLYWVNAQPGTVGSNILSRLRQFQDTCHTKHCAWQPLLTKA